MLHFLLSHRRLIFRIIVGVAAFIFFGFFVPIIISTTTVDYSRLFFGPEPISIPPPSPGRFTLLGKDALKVTLDQIESFRLDGTFAASMHCFRSDDGQTDNFGKCQSSVYRTLPPPHLVIILDQLAEFSSQSSYQKEADRIFGEFLRRCVADKGACENGFDAIDWRYRQEGNESLASALEFAGNWLLSTTPRSTSEQIIAIHELLTLYRYFDDPLYLVKANELFKGLPEEDDENNKDFICGKHWVGAELARLLSNDELFIQARAFFDNIDNEKENISHIGGLNMCLEGLRFLNSETGDIKYSRLHRELVSQTLSNFWDTPYQPKFTGDYGVLLLDYSKSETNRMLNFKYVNETAWFLTHVIRYRKVVLSF